MDARMPVVLLDRIGYAFYHLDGRPFLPADRYAVRLVTDIARLDEAVGEELESVVGVPRLDERALADAVRFQAAYGGRPAQRLVAVTERILLLAAGLREELGIPGATVAETTLFRDKVAMKRHLRERGIRVPDFAPFDEAAADGLLRRYGRVVAKPRLGAGAVDIFVLDDREAVAAFAREHADRLADFEVERFVDGQLCHVDSVVQDAKVVAAVAARYLDEPTSFERLRPCRDVGLPPGPELDALLDFNQRVLECYPGFTGVTHHEMFLTTDGVCFCEIGARAGGGGVIAGFLSRTGINLDEAVVQSQLLGTVPAPAAVPDHLTGFVVVYAGPGTLRAPIQVPDEPWVLEAQILAKPGERLTGPANCNDAVAIVSVRGDSEADVIDRLASTAEHATPMLSDER